VIVVGGDVLSTELHVLSGGNGSDTLQIGGTASSVARAVNLVGSSVTGLENLDLAANTGAINAVTMTGAQYQLFTGTKIGVDGNDTITLTTAPTIAVTAGDGTVGTISVVEGTTMTIAAAATAAAQVITETGTAGTVSTFTLGAGAYTGVWTGIDALDVVKVVTGTNIAGNTGLNAATIDFQSATATLTLSAAQNGSVTFTGASTGTQTISVSDIFTTDPLIESYAALATSTVTIATGHTAVNLAAAAGTVTTVNVGANALTGTIALDNGADVLVLTAGSNIAGVNAGASISATAIVSVDGAVTMTQTQYAALLAINAATAITDGGVVGVDQITLTTAGTVAADADIEAYVLANGANTFTFSTTAASVTGGTAADTINVVLADVSAIATGVTLPVDGVTDRISVTNTALQIDQTGKITVSGFLPGAGGDAFRLISTAQNAGVSLSNVNYVAVGSTANTNQTVTTGSVFEITGSNVADLTAVAAGGAIELLLVAALGTLPASASRYTVVVYSGADAGIYEMLTITSTMSAAADFEIELVAVLTGVGANALTESNFF
jgi:hypothetical protein